MTLNVIQASIDLGEYQTLTPGASVVYDLKLLRDATLATPGAGSTIANITNGEDGAEGYLLIQGGPNNPAWDTDWDFGSQDGWTLTNNVTLADVVRWTIAPDGKIYASVLQGYQLSF